MNEEVQHEAAPDLHQEKVTEPVHSPNELPSIDEAMKATWTRLKERLLPLSLLSALPLVFTFLVSLLGFITLYLVSKSRPDLSPYDIVFPAGAIAAVCGIILVMVVSTWSTLSLFTLANHPVLLSLRDAFRMTRHKILSFWGIAIFMLLVAGSYVFFIIPGLIFSVFFTFSIFTFLVENEEGMNALVKSREYVRGHFWKTVGYLMIPVLMAFILSLLIGLIGKVTGYGASLLRLVEQILLPAFTAVYLSVVFNRYRLLKPNLVVTNATKQKTVYLVIGIIGWIIAGTVTLLVLSFFSKHPEQLKLLQMSRMMSR